MILLELGSELPNVQGAILPLPASFPFHNWETVKAVNLAFGSIQYHFISDILDKYGIPNSPQSPDFGQKFDGSISDFQISV